MAEKESEERKHLTMKQYQEDENNVQKQLLENLIQYTCSPDPKLRIAAYTALGRVPAKESVDCLLRGLEDGHPAVREIAKRSLEQLVQFCCVYGYQKMGA